MGLIDLGLGKNRMGGSALAQALGQLGNDPPDIDGGLFKRAFEAVQKMVAEGVLLALHDRSDGGLIVALMEMCMASNCGFNIAVRSARTAIPELFSEECGWVFEFDELGRGRINQICSQHGITFNQIGQTFSAHTCAIGVQNSKTIFSCDICKIRSIWEATSLELEKQQNNLACVESERAAVPSWPIGPDEARAYNLTFVPEKTPEAVMCSSEKPKMAVIRERRHEWG